MRNLVLGRLGAIVLVAVLCGLGTMQGASAAMLSDLIATHGSITQGDKLFDNFDVTITGYGSYGADASAIDVKGIEALGENGLEFGVQLSGGIFANSLVTVGSYVDVTLSFDVTVQDPQQKLHDLTLSYNGASSAPDGFTQIVESAYNGVTAVGQAHVYNPPLVATDHIILADPGQYTKLHIEKDVLVVAGTNGFSSISIIRQTFSQVPEPATLLLLASGLLFIRRRRS